MNELQKCQLDILKAVDSVCKKNGISYFALGGTFLGAVRHKGFIPWDDDIDIGMPRSDFERFVKIADQYLEYPYKVLYRTEIFPMKYAKVHDINTTFVEEAEKNHPECYKGVFIDVFPLDGTPKFRFTRKIYLFLIRTLIRAMSSYRLLHSVKQEGMTIKERLACLFPYSVYHIMWDKLVRMFDFSTSEFTSFTWDVNVNKWVIPTKCFKELTDYKFEDFDVPGCKDFDKYLCIQYGNYMQLPPLEQRQTHSDGAIIDLKKSYTDYVNNNTML